MIALYLIAIDLLVCVYVDVLCLIVGLTRLLVSLMDVLIVDYYGLNDLALLV